MRISDWRSDVCSSDLCPLGCQLALADALAHLCTAVVVGDVGLAGFLALDDVPAGLGLERRRNPAVLQPGDLCAELGPELVLGEPAQLATLVLAEGVVGFFLRHFGEVRSAGDACAQGVDPGLGRGGVARSEEHTSDLQSLMRISYAVFCLKKKNNTTSK